MASNDVKHKANKESTDCQEKHHLIYKMHGKWNMQLEVTNCIDQNNFCWTYYWFLTGSQKMGTSNNFKDTGNANN
jgi:hypothetical protein